MSDPEGLTADQVTRRGTPLTYFYVEAHKEDGDKTRFEQTVVTRKTDPDEQKEAIWLHVYRALRPKVGDTLQITCMSEVDPPESAD